MSFNIIGLPNWLKIYKTSSNTNKCRCLKNQETPKTHRNPTKSTSSRRDPIQPQEHPFAPMPEPLGRSPGAKFPNNAELKTLGSFIPLPIQGVFCRCTPQIFGGGNSIWKCCYFDLFFNVFLIPTLTFTFHGSKNSTPRPFCALRLSKAFVKSFCVAFWSTKVTLKSLNSSLCSLGCRQFPFFLNKPWGRIRHMTIYRKI